MNHCKNTLLHHKRLIFNTIEIATLRCPATKTTFNGPDVKCTPLKRINQRDFPFIQHMIGIQSSPLTKWFYPSHKGSSTIKKSQRWLLVLGCCLSLINNKGPLVVPPATNPLGVWKCRAQQQHPGLLRLMASFLSCSASWTWQSSRKSRTAAENRKWTWN